MIECIQKINRLKIHATRLKSERRGDLRQPNTCDWNFAPTTHCPRNRRSTPMSSVPVIQRVAEVSPVFLLQSRSESFLIGVGPKRYYGLLARWHGTRCEVQRWSLEAARNLKGLDSFCCCKTVHMNTGPSGSLDVRARAREGSFPLAVKTRRYSMALSSRRIHQDSSAKLNGECRNAAVLESCIQDPYTFTRILGQSPGPITLRIER